MSIFDRRPRLRWAIPAAAGVLIVTGTLAGTVAATADSGLPPKTAQELLVGLQAPQATALSGTVVATADLGLPELPTGMGASSELTSLASGSHTIRVWSDGPDRARMALLGSADEADVIRNGRDVWSWSSTAQTADHYVLPEHRAAKPADLAPASHLPSSPQEAAALALAAVDETTEVTTSGVSKVAGRPVYELILTPKQKDTLVARVVVSIDGETSVPLRVAVYSKQLTDPAFEVGFTSVDFAAPDASLFTFTPPPGATVTEHPAPTYEGAGPGMKPASGDTPVVVGTGWDQVVIATIPPDALPAPAGDTSATDPMAMLESLPTTTGAWGTGRVLSGTLVSVILTDDGRVAIGAVSPAVLGAALAAK
jgi:outer membrane lipoprotein-sorting protein